MSRSQVSRQLRRDALIIEREAIKQMRPLIRKFHEAVAKPTADVDLVDSQYVKAFQEPMKRVLMAANAQARFRIRSLAPTKEPVQLSVMSDVLAKYRRLNPAKFEQLDAWYDRLTLQFMTGEAERIERAVRETVLDNIDKPRSDRQSAVLKVMQALGVHPDKHHHIATLVRTHTQTAYSAGRWTEEQNPEIQEILWGYEYVDFGDANVREDHQELNGTVLPKEDSFWDQFYPPNGWNCRCVTVPLFSPEPQVRKAEVPLEQQFRVNPGKLLATVVP